MTKLAKIFGILLIAFCLPANGQRVRYTISPKNAETVLHKENVRATVDYLTAPSLGGRATGSDGARRSALWLENRFRDLSLEPLGGSWMHGFRISSELFGRNVLGLIPGSGAPARYVIVMAHYDNLGTLGGTFYPGADSNASGVAALLELGRMFRHMADCKKSYGTGLILVALDGKEKDLCGAADLWRLLSGGKLLDPVSGSPVQKDQIALIVNLDQLGATLSPLSTGRPDYLMMLSEEGSSRRSTLEKVNREQGIDLQLGYDYYGSKDFTNLFFRRISDQRVFLEHGIPSVMFTSGITLNNNKPYDDADSLDYDILCRRIRLIFYWLDKVL